MPLVKVIEMGQHISTGNIEEQDFDTFNTGCITGRDSDAAKRLGIANITRRHVLEDAQPYIGSVWFIRGEDGKMKRRKAHYDTSD